MIRDHVGFVSRLGKGFSRAGLSRYPYSDSTFQLTRLFIGRDNFKSLDRTLRERAALRAQGPSLAIISHFREYF